MDSQEQLLTEISSSVKSRRNLLKGAVAGAAGVTGLAVAGTALWSQGAVHAAGTTAKCHPDTPATILAIAATAEQLAIS